MKTIGIVIILVLAASVILYRWVMKPDKADPHYRMHNRFNNFK